MADEAPKKTEAAKAPAAKAPAKAAAKATAAKAPAKAVKISVEPAAKIATGGSRRCSARRRLRWRRRRRQHRHPRQRSVRTPHRPRRPAW